MNSKRALKMFEGFELPEDQCQKIQEISKAMGRSDVGWVLSAIDEKIAREKRALEVLQGFDQARGR